jgi:UDPglucose 6-dehydrogenase
MDNAAAVSDGVEFCSDAYSAAEGSDAVVLITEWNEFKNLDLERIKTSMRRPILLDGRNLYEPKELERVGFDYLGVARGGGPVETVAEQHALR